MASEAENVSIWWRDHVCDYIHYLPMWQLHRGWTCLLFWRVLRLLLWVAVSVIGRELSWRSSLALTMSTRSMLLWHRCMIPRCRWYIGLVQIGRWSGATFKGKHNITPHNKTVHRQISNMRRTKSQNLNVSRPVLQLSLCIILEPGVKSRMKMQLEQRRKAMLQLHLSDQQFYCLLRTHLILEIWRYPCHRVCRVITKYDRYIHWKCGLMWFSGTLTKK